MARLSPALSASLASALGSGNSSGETCAINSIVGAARRRSRNRDRLGVEGGADQIAKLVVANRGRVSGPQLNGPPSRLEGGVTSDEPGVTTLIPAVNRHPVLPHTKEEPAAPNLIGWDLVRKPHRGIGVPREDQPMEAVEERSIRGVDGRDVISNA